MREIRNVKELRKRVEKLKKKGYSISEIADELELEDCDVRYIQTTKNNKIKNWIKENKGIIGGAAMVIGGYILTVYSSYKWGYNSGKEEYDPTISITMGELLEGDRFSMGFKRESGRIECVPFAGAERFCEEVNEVIHSNDRS